MDLCHNASSPMTAPSLYDHGPRRCTRLDGSIVAARKQYFDGKERERAAPHHEASVHSSRASHKHNHQRIFHQCSPDPNDGCFANLPDSFYEARSACSDVRVADWVRSQEVDKLVAVPHSLFDAMFDRLIAQETAQEQLRDAVITCLKGAYPVWKGPQGLLDDPPTEMDDVRHDESLTEPPLVIRRDRPGPNMGPMPHAAGQPRPSPTQQNPTGMLAQSVLPNPSIEDLTSAFPSKDHDTLGPVDDAKSFSNSYQNPNSHIYQKTLPGGVDEADVVLIGSIGTLPQSWLDDSSSQCSQEQSDPALPSSSVQQQATSAYPADCEKREPSVEENHTQEVASSMPALGVLDADTSTGAEIEGSNQRANIVAGLRKKVSRLFARHHDTIGSTSEPDRGPVKVRGEETNAHLEVPDAVYGVPRPPKRLPRLSSVTPLARTVLTRRSAPSLRV